MSKLHKISTSAGGNRVADVLFLHGLGGDAFSTWRSGKDQSTSWPHWLAAEFPDVCFWSLGYAASPTKRLGWLRRRISGNHDAGHAMSLPDRARDVVDLLVQHQLGSRPLLLICHSLGGLLAKQILRRARDEKRQQHQDIFTNTRAILFLGTPHHGASLASMAKKFRVLFGPTANIDDLMAHDAHLGDLYDWYRSHCATDRVETVTYFEDRDVLGFRIVNRTSSQAGVGHDAVPLDEDHLSLAKPRDRTGRVVNKARELVKLVIQGISASNDGNGNVDERRIVLPNGNFPATDGDFPPGGGSDPWISFVVENFLAEFNKLSTNMKSIISRELNIQSGARADVVRGDVTRFFLKHSNSVTHDVNVVSCALNQIDRLIEPASLAIQKVLMNMQDWLMTTLVCPTDNADIAVIRDSCDGVLFVGHPVAAELLFSVADQRKPTFILADDGKIVGDQLLNLASPTPGDQRPLILVQHYVTEMADRVGAVTFDNQAVDQNDYGKCIQHWTGQLKLIFRAERARTGSRFYCCCPLPVDTTNSAQLLSLLRDFSSQIPDLGVFRLHTNQGTLSAEEVIVPLLHKRFERSP